MSIGTPFSGPVPRDLIALLAVVFGTFTLQFFQTTAIVPALLRLSPSVWEHGFIWQLVTYGFVGFGGPSLWILLELLILFWFGRDVFTQLGRRRFWGLLGWSILGAGVFASLTQLLAGPLTDQPFQLMQGQRILLVIVIAAFATMYGDATIYLFFVLPLRARWFLWLGILFGFMGFLGSKDLAGFVGICVATGITYWELMRRRRRGGGMRGGGLRGWWDGLQRSRFERKVDRVAKRRGLRVVRGDDEEPPTIH